MVLVQLIHVRLCLCGHPTHTRTILNRLSVLFHTFPRPGTWVVRRCNGRSCRRPRSWRGWRGWGWRGARSSRGSRHRGFGGSLCTKNMARDIKRPRATPLQSICDVCFTLFMQLVLFVICLCLSMCRWLMFVVFTRFTLVAPSIDVFGSWISHGAHWCLCDMTKWQLQSGKPLKRPIFVPSSQSRSSHTVVISFTLHEVSWPILLPLSLFLWQPRLQGAPTMKQSRLSMNAPSEGWLDACNIV